MKYFFSAIARQNEHWEERSFYFNQYQYKRKILTTLESSLNNRFIITLQGLRRTGKTVLQEQLIQSAIEREQRERKGEFPVANLLRFSFESDLTVLFEAADLEKLLDYYFREICSVRRVA